MAQSCLSEGLTSALSSRESSPFPSALPHTSKGLVWNGPCCLQQNPLVSSPELSTQFITTWDPQGPGSP